MPARCCAGWDCPSGQRKNLKTSFHRSKDWEQNGNYRKTRERQKEAEVFQPPAQPLQSLRASTGVPAQVRHLPLVLPLARAQGRNSRRHEVVLVSVWWY